MTRRERLERKLELRREWADKAEAKAQSSWVTIEKCAGEYTRVTFAEKPDRSILDALKAAGFFWSNGSWAGKEQDLPQVVRDLLTVSAGDLSSNS